MAAPVRDPGHIPGPVFIPNVVAVRLHWTLANLKVAYNVMHASYLTPPTFTQAQLNSMFDSIKGLYDSTGIDDDQDTQTFLTKLGLRDMRESPTPGSGFAEVVSNTGSVHGSATGGEPMPAQIALVVSLKTNLSRQANRGRVYIPGWNSGANEATGKAKDTVLVNAVEWITAIQTVLNANGLKLCIAQPARAAYTSDRSGVSYPARPAGHQDVTQIVCLDKVWDTQRLRARV